MFSEKITFDRFVRGALVGCGVCLAYLLLKTLSSVLWPFFVAWLLAYIMYPMVIFFEKKCRLHYRALSIAVTLIVYVSAIVGTLMLMLPPMVDAFVRFGSQITTHVTQLMGDTDVAAEVTRFMDEMDENQVVQLLQQNEVRDALHIVMMQAWGLISGTIGMLLGLVNVFVVLLYMFFLLMDYEKMTEGWKYLIPNGQRGLASRVVEDVEHGMSAYFRGQGLVALSVGVLFSIGFLIIDFPMAIGLGLFIGLLNMVPYMQLLGFVPTVILAFLKSSETGENFWVILLCATAVFCVVQVIQDMILTPKIMGRVMGLNPAVILLSLSVWGCLLGVIGLIIALPLTTLLWSYYRRYIVRD